MIPFLSLEKAFAIKVRESEFNAFLFCGLCSLIIKALKGDRYPILLMSPIYKVALSGHESISIYKFSHKDCRNYTGLEWRICVLPSAFTEYLTEGLMQIHKIDVFFYEWAQNWLFDLLSKNIIFSSATV